MKQNIKNTLFSNTIIYSSGRILGAVASFALLPLFTKKLSLEEFGLIGILWVIEPILARIINLGSDSVLAIKFYKLNHETFSNHVYHMLTIILTMGLIVTGIMIFNTNLIKSFLDDKINESIIICFVVSMLSVVLFTIMKSFLQYSGKAKEVVILNAFPKIIITIITYYLITQANANYTAYIVAMAIGNGIFGFIAIIYLINKYPITNFRFSINILKGILKIGLPILPDTLGGLLLTSGDRIVIKYYLGLKAVAIYVYGYKFANFIVSCFFEPFEKALGPIVMQKSVENFQEANRYCVNIVDLLLFISSIFFSIIVIPLKNVIALMGTSQYAGSYNIFIIALIGILLFYIRQVIFILFNHLERTDLNMIFILIAATSNILLNIVFVPIYGVLAAAYTTIISYFILLVFSVFFINKMIYEKFSLLNIIYKIIPLTIYLIGLYVIDLYDLNMNVIVFYGLKIVMLMIIVFWYEKIFSGKNLIKKYIPILLRVNKTY